MVTRSCHQTENRTSAAPARARLSRGFSLVEILVVLVVLLIGILSILRLFPGGFLTIQRTGELSNGQALSSQQIEAQKERLALAEAVVVPDTFDPTGNNNKGQWKFRSDVTPDDLSDAYDINNNFDPYASDINKFRYVIGESFRVPTFSPNSDTGAVGATYMLSQGPVFNQFDGTHEYLNVYASPLERTEQSSVADSSGSTGARNVPTLRQGQYAIDYVNRRIAFYPRIKNNRVTPTRSFNFRFDYYISASGGVNAKSASITIDVPDVDDAPDPQTSGVDPIWQDIFITGNKPTDFDDKLGFLYNSETVSRKFKLIKNNGPLLDLNTEKWSDDPYEYAFYSAQEINGSGNPGVLVFNPYGHDYLVQTSTGTQPLIANVDYETFDNHIIREDRSLSGSGPYTIRASVPFLRINGDIQADQTPYKGMYGGGVNSPDIQIFNANTGHELAELNGAQVTKGSQTVPIDPKNYVTSDDADAAFEVDARTGIIRLSPTFIETNKLQSQTLRIFYKANRDWGLQVQKAAAHYDQAQDKDQPTYHTFLLSSSSTFPGRIYFAPCDTGKTVILGRFTITEPNGMNSVANSYENETYQIHSAVDSTNSDPVNLPYIDITEQHPNMTGFNAVLTGRAVENVQGGSLKSRVVWNDGVTTYTSGGKKRANVRWRKADTDTFLLQGAAR